MDTKAMRNMVRVGIVSEVCPADCAARVVFEEKDSATSPVLPIITRGGKVNRDFWLPDIGEQVVCLFACNDKNFSTGWILGAHYKSGAGNADSVDKRRVDFAYGSFVEFDRATGGLTIQCTGDIVINGQTISLN